MSEYGTQHIDGVNVIERTYENEQKMWTRAKRFAPFVFGISKHACLVHRVAHVSICWYDYQMHVLVKRQRPRMSATTICGQSFALDAARSRTCRIPSPEASLCGRCVGDVATFGARRIADRAARWAARKAASVKLGCEVKGY